MSSAGRNSISGCFQYGLQDGYLSLKPHVKGGLFPLSSQLCACTEPLLRAQCVLVRRMGAI